MSKKRRIANREVKLIGREKGKEEIPLLTSESGTLKQLEDENRTLKGLIEQKETEMREQKDSFLRKLAESENSKRLMKKETESTVENNSARLFREILLVVDNFDRAIESASKTNDRERIVEGIKMIDKQFHHTFEKLGVTKFSSKGEKFDPSRHEAISVVYNPALKDGEVVEEHQRGYMFNGKVLRPAKVIVNKAENESKEETND